MNTSTHTGGSSSGNSSIVRGTPERVNNGNGGGGRERTRGIRYSAEESQAATAAAAAAARFDSVFQPVNNNDARDAAAIRDAREAAAMGTGRGGTRGGGDRRGALPPPPLAPSPGSKVELYSEYSDSIDQSLEALIVSQLASVVLFACMLFKA